VEWEKAARGADGRLFPWGSAFDATFCKMRDSREGFCQPEPVGAFAADESPYGVRDLAGTIREWCLDGHGTLRAADALAEAETAGAGPGQRGGARITRGGSWVHNPIAARAASRYVNFASDRYSSLGFRLALAVPRG
jgi:serine/threonine-protein kinase